VTSVPPTPIPTPTSTLPDCDTIANFWERAGAWYRGECR
jgi:hypothetical protein